MENFENEITQLTEGFDSKKASLIRNSFALALKAHEGQKRMSGKPYITHTIEVAKILKEMKMDSLTISAGLLHDVIEDTKYTVADIKKSSGDNVSFLVEGVTHVTAKVFKTRGEKFSESLKKMFLAMAKDIRVIIIKLADRLHNMRTIEFLSEERQKAIAQETLNIYAPLAHRLGMAKVKSELEDISFGILNPGAYRQIADKIAEKKVEREKRIVEISEVINKEVEKLGVKAEITGRPKHFYSIYQKMMRENKKFEDIYDLIALRIITDTVSNCYTVLGIIHNTWKPVPGRFKDYIAMPKSNMYQSLHTTVLDSKGVPVELQIRTVEMDEIAEEGIAAHWNYKEDRAFDRETDNAFIWVRQLLDWQSNLRESEEFINELKIDLFDEEVFVFTPKGEVKELVRGSTVLDFAYSVHSDLGDKCAGAKVNGKWVTIKYELRNGDIIEILTGPLQHPTIDWLKVARTTKAKNRIRHWLRTNQNMKENTEKGKNLLLKKLSAYDISYDDITKEMWEKLFTHYNLKSEEDLLAGIGYGEFSEFRVVNAVRRYLRDRKKEAVIKPDVTKKIARGGEIIVDGKYSDIAFRLARCCNPVPGDEITGIFTKKGISVHRKNCSTLFINKITAPLVKVAWSDTIENYYSSRIKITAKNRDGLVNDIANTVTKNSAFLTSISSNVVHETRFEGEVEIRIKGQGHMKELISSLKQVKGVSEVERVT